MFRFFFFCFSLSVPTRPAGQRTRAQRQRTTKTFSTSFGSRPHLAIRRGTADAAVGRENWNTATARANKSKHSKGQKGKKGKTRRREENSSQHNTEKKNKKAPDPETTRVRIPFFDKKKENSASGE